MAVRWDVFGGAGAENRVKHGPAPITSPASGHEMFMSYWCILSRQGRQRRRSRLRGAQAGAGRPAALAKKNGQLSGHERRQRLSGKTSLAAHGSQEMLVWGAVFWRMSQGHPVEVQLRIANLNEYIKSLQVN